MNTGSLMGIDPASNPFYQLLINNMPGLAVLVFDHDLRYLAVEGHFNAAMGYSPESMRGKTLAEVLPPASVEVLEPHYRSALGGNVTEAERAFGESYYHCRFVPVRDASGRIFAGMVLSEDITPQKKTELKLATSEARYRLLAEHSSDLIVEVDVPTRTITYASHSCERIVGYTFDEMLGQSIMSFAHPDDRNTFSNAIGDYIANPASLAQPYVRRVRHKAGYVRCEARCDNAQGEHPRDGG